MKDHTFYIDKAMSAFDEGFTSNAAKKRALDSINRAYEDLVQGIRDLILVIPRDDRTEEQNALYWGIPMYVHQWRPAHAELAVKLFPNAESTVHVIDHLINLRSTIKDAPLIPVERKANKEIESKIHETILQIMERRQAQYARGLRLQEIFGQLPVTASVHVVVNQYGTQFLRTFYYMNGTLTPLNVIIAVMQAKEDKDPA
jgi:hypothetical protein